MDPSTGKLSGAGNLLSGNLGSGLQINQANGNLVQGNYIGTDVTGEIALGNDPTGGFAGVNLVTGSNNMIGGISSVDVHGNLSGLGNLISGNSEIGQSDGIDIGGGVSNTVAGNYIGTTANGMGMLGNGGYGILVYGGQDTQIGTDGGSTYNAAEGNVISDNADGGISVEDPGTNGTMIAGNLIGTDRTGSHALGNGLFGVNVYNGPTGTSIEGNVLSGNGFNGVNLYTDVTGTLIADNLIGTDITGTLPLGNDAQGILIAAGSSYNQIGGSPCWQT